MEKVKVLRDTRGRFSKVLEDQISVFRDSKGRFMKTTLVVFKGKTLQRVWSDLDDAWVYLQLKEVE